MTAKKRWYNKFNTGVPFALAALLIAACLLLTGCAEIRITKPLDHNTLLEINDTTCSYGTGVLRLLEAREEYSGDEIGLWDMTIDETTMANYVKEAAFDDLQRYTSAQAMAASLTVFITDAERAKAEADAAKLMQELGSRYNLSQYRISAQDAVDLFIKRIYYNKVYEKLSQDILMEISEVETKAIEINYVLIPISDGVEVAERMRNEIKSGFDFTEVCSSYGYKAELNVTVTRGTFPESFEKIAFALRDNEVSEIIVARDGYYIIYCLEDYMVANSLANRNRVISDGKQARFDKAYQEFAASSKMRFNSAEWNKLDLKSMN